MTEHFAILSGIGYKVIVADRQVIFEESPTVCGCFSKFAFERPYDINDSPGIWYLVYLETSSDRIPVSHIAAALVWCGEMFGKSFESYRGALA